MDNPFVKATVTINVDSDIVGVVAVRADGTEEVHDLTNEEAQPLLLGFAESFLVKGLLEAAAAAAAAGGDGVLSV